MILIVDASVAAKWFFAEVGHEPARVILESGATLIAPDLIVPEVCNVAWRKVARKEIGTEQAQAVARQLPAMLNQLIASSALAPRAVELAIKLQHPVYDCFYLALTEVADGALITADEKLLNIAGQAGLNPKSIRRLDNRH